MKPARRRPSCANKPASSPGQPSGNSQTPSRSSRKPSGRSGGPGGAPPGATPARPILDATSTRRQVVAQLDATDALRIKPGQRASITLPDGHSTPGTVARIGRSAGASGGLSVYLTLIDSNL